MEVASGGVSPLGSEAGGTTSALAWPCLLHLSSGFKRKWNQLQAETRQPGLPLAFKLSDTADALERVTF